ncbi:MAG TPA: ABC transporter permease [Clostridiales bacterium]|jgi:ABC-2 type transport system permease protein|nr:ABC transporter permease [Clostridiales bacterium]
MNRLWKITAVEWKLINREFITLFFALIFPVLMLLLFGTIYGNRPSEIMGGYGTVDVSTPGYTNMIIAVTGLMSFPLTLAQYREKKILRRFMVTPVKPVEILLSQFFVNILMTVLGLVVLIALGKVVFDLHFYGNVLEAIVAFIVILLGIFSIGLFIGGLSKNMKMCTTIAYIVYFPMLFLSGATIPIEIMPQSIINISKVLPMSYGVSLLKGIWLGGHLSDHVKEIVILLSIAVVSGGFAVKFFKWE